MEVSQQKPTSQPQQQIPNVPFLQYVAFVLNHYEHIILTKEQINDPQYHTEYYTINGVNLKKFL